MTGTNHHNGLKTAILMGGLWALLLQGLGKVVSMVL